MNPKLRFFAVGYLTLQVHAAVAAVPQVAVDIAPVHSLVTQVMEGVGKPDLLIPAEASPHEYTLRPSQAKALADADVVFWIGEGLTPWLEKALTNVSATAHKVEMLEVEGTVSYAYREGATFEGHDHGENHDDDHHEEAHHDEHDDDHYEEAHHDDHDDHHEEAHHHDHEGADPHAWLDPMNAKIWVEAIAQKLSEKDPANAATYKKNAQVAKAKLDELINSTQATISALNQPKFIVFHDAYQYFEKRFGISAAGSISLGDAQDPSPARIREIQTTVKKLGVTCAYTEPQYNPGLVRNVFEGSTVSTIGVMDPLGSAIAPGSQHYDILITNMAKSLSECK